VFVTTQSCDQRNRESSLVYCFARHSPGNTSRGQLLTSSHLSCSVVPAEKIDGRSGNSSNLASLASHKLQHKYVADQQSCQPEIFTKQFNPMYLGDLTKDIVHSENIPNSSIIVDQ